VHSDISWTDSTYTERSPQAFQKPSWWAGGSRLTVWLDLLKDVCITDKFTLRSRIVVQLWLLICFHVFFSNQLSFQDWLTIEFCGAFLDITFIPILTLIIFIAALLVRLLWALHTYYTEEEEAPHISIEASDFLNEHDWAASNLTTYFYFRNQEWSDDDVICALSNDSFRFISCSETAPSRFCNLYSFSNFQRVSFTARLPVSKINSFLRESPVKK